MGDEARRRLSEQRSGEGAPGALSATIANCGKGSERQFVTIIQGTGENRREVFVDAKDLQSADFPGSYNDALLFRGQSRLSELAPRYSFDAGVNPHGNLRYKTDFDLGNTVKVIAKPWGVAMTARITEIEETYDADGLSLGIIFGKSELTLAQKMRSDMSDMKTSLLAPSGGGSGDIPDASVTTAKLAADAVTTEKIAAGAVTAAEVADNAVTGAKIAAGAVGTDKIADNAVTSAKIADGAVATADLADLSVTAAKIANSTITGGKLASGAVATANLADGSVTSGKLAAGAVGTDKIRTEPTTGTEYCSDWVISSGTLRRNTLPTAPSSFTVSPAVYQSGEIILSWSGAVTGTSAIKNYIIQLCTSADNSTWSAYSALATVTTSATSGNYTYTPGTMAVYTRYRICATDALDCVSGYTVSASLRKNNPPPVPTIAAPKAGAITYNTNPRILLTLGTEPDSERQMLCVRGADGVWQDSVNNPESFSRSGWLGNGTAVIYRHGNLTPGAKTVTVKAKDEGVQAESGETSRSFTVAASPFVQITANETPVKAAHINILRTAVNNIRNYYGMAAAVWSEEVTPGRTQVRNWTYHILEIRKAVDQVVDVINRHDTVSGFDVPAFEWIPIQPGRPRAEVMAQLHNLILSL